MVKAMWVKAIAESAKHPQNRLKSPSCLLNELYEKITGNQCTTANVYAVRDDKKGISETLRFRPSDGLYKCTVEWAGLDSQYPKLVSCHKFNGLASPDILFTNGHPADFIIQAINESL